MREYPASVRYHESSGAKGEGTRVLYGAESAPRSQTRGYPQRVESDGQDFEFDPQRAIDRSET